MVCGELVIELLVSHHLLQFEVCLHLPTILGHHPGRSAPKSHIFIFGGLSCSTVRIFRLVDRRINRAHNHLSLVFLVRNHLLGSHLHHAPFIGRASFVTPGYKVAHGLVPLVAPLVILLVNVAIWAILRHRKKLLAAISLLLLRLGLNN